MTRWRLTLNAPAGGGAPSPPTPNPQSSNFVIVATLIFAISVVADFAAAFQILGWLGIVGFALVIVSVIFADRLRQANRLHILWHPRSRADFKRAAPIDAAMIIGLVLLLLSRLSFTSSAPTSPDPAAPTQSAASTTTETPPAESSQVSPACVSGEGPNIYSHSRFASEAGRDVVVDVLTSGYIQQRFFARSDYISSVAVIIARPPTSDQEPFDPRQIGEVRLTLYRANDQAENVENIPIALTNSGATPDPSGVVQQAGPNNEQTVFRLCQVPVEIGQRYAFRVTNEERGVPLGFSLSVEPGENTSMDIIGTRTGMDRSQINYHQVAGYVCSTTNC